MIVPLTGMTCRGTVRPASIHRVLSRCSTGRTGSLGRNRIAPTAAAADGVPRRRTVRLDASTVWASSGERPRDLTRRHRHPPEHLAVSERSPWRALRRWAAGDDHGAAAEGPSPPTDTSGTAASVWLLPATGTSNVTLGCLAPRGERRFTSATAPAARRVQTDPLPSNVGPRVVCERSGIRAPRARPSAERARPTSSDRECYSSKGSRG